MKTLDELLREREPDLSELLRERDHITPSDVKLPRGFGELVTAPLEEAMASLAARRHILELGRKR